MADKVLTALRQPSAVYRAGSGETLPAESNRYDLAIIENCIDHVQDMDGVMRELARVLRPGAWLYITVNCRGPWGYYVHRILSRLRLDPGHPHTFTPARLERLVRRFGFRILDQQLGSYQQARAKDQASDSARARLKARLGTSEYRAALVARLEGLSGSKAEAS
jgi:ubiquinone/menaquinone biosynthesis C-methylase UbiE